MGGGPSGVVGTMAHVPTQSQGSKFKTLSVGSCSPSMFLNSAHSHILRQRFAGASPRSFSNSIPNCCKKTQKLGLSKAVGDTIAAEITLLQETLILLWFFIIVPSRLFEAGEAVSRNENGARFKRDKNIRVKKFHENDFFVFIPIKILVLEWLTRLNFRWRLSWNYQLINWPWT